MVRSFTMILDLDHLSVALPCFLFLIYYFFVYRISISPLSKIPNAHPTSPISPLWILRLRFQQKGTKTIHEMHKKRGPVLRVSPNEVSVNCVKDGVLTIYPAFEKPNWYDVFRNYGYARERLPLFSTCGYCLSCSILTDH